MTRKLILIVSTAWSLAIAGGCGNSAGLVPVSGKVLYKGEPASGAVVYFHREGGSGTPAQPIPSGTVEDDGTFALSSDNLGNGAKPGQYAVLIEWPDRAGNGVVPVKTRGKTNLVKRSRVRSGPDRLGGRYFNIANPLLHAEVKSSWNQLEPFDLKD
ncbi:MAG: hypothetical protein ACLQIB_19330 [Isosphaeraceae bacterium]